MSRSNVKPMSFLKACLIASISMVALSEAPPLWVAGYNATKIAAFCGLLASGPPLTSKVLRMLADRLDHIAALRPRGMKGTAAWVTSIQELSHLLVHSSFWNTGHAPYWGCLKRGFLGFGRQPIFADITAVAVVLGASGAGKDIVSNLPNVLAIPGSKVILDFDGSTSAIMADALRQLGQEVRILNFDDTFPEILGESDQYNPLHVLADNFERPGGILDVSSDSTQFAHALYPEPKSEGEGSNKYFRDGSRTILKFAMQMCVLVQGREASMADVLALIQDKEALLQHALWAAGRLEQDEPASHAPANTNTPSNQG